MVGLLAVMPLAAWPGIPRPFSTPKLYLLVGAVMLLGPVAWMAARRERVMAEGDRGAWIRAVALFWLVSWSASALLGDIVSLDALLLGLAGGLLALILLALAPRPEALAAALTAGSTGVALVALLQWAGLDPFVLAGWVAPIAGASPRLRVYGTLGNPNFVAALLTGSAPIAAGLLASLSARRTTTPVVTTTRVGVTTDVGSSAARRPNEATETTAVATTTPVVMTTPVAATTTVVVADSHAASRHRAGNALRRGVLGAALLLQFLAIAATGSRAAALGLVAAGVTVLTLAWCGGSRRSGSAGTFAALLTTTRLAAPAAFGALGVAALLVVLSPARPLGDTLAGRLYIWRVTAPHALEAPMAGRGPGAFELLHPVWEAAARPPADHPDARFAGPQQHTHNDYLEALVDRGLAGPVTILAALATLWAAGGRRARRVPDRPVALGAAAAVAALGAVACVDFPLARPAELALWWSALALTRQTDRGRPDPGQRGHA